jgi:hypothetical protein
VGQIARDGHDIVAYEIRRKFKNEKDLFFKLHGNPDFPHGLWLRRFWGYGRSVSCCEVEEKLVKMMM